MKNFIVIVSRYNSVSLNIQANTQEEAEKLALEADLQGMFEDRYENIEIADSYEDNE